MVGRVTQGMMNMQTMRNINNNLRKLSLYQEQASTGKRIHRPSDDPVGISFSMRYRSELAANEQYQRNVDMGLSWLNNTEQVVGQAGDVMQRIRELTVNAANSTNPQAALDSIGAEINQLYEELVDIGNSQFNGKYVLNGQMNNMKPYTVENADGESTDNSHIMFEIGMGVQLAVNVTGEELFGEADSAENTFVVLKDLMNAIDQGEHDQISQLIGRLDGQIDQILGVRADIGAKMNRIELAEERLKDMNVNLQTLQSKTEDADMAEVFMNLKMSENVYQASLASGARLIQPSLLDYLR